MSDENLEKWKSQKVVKWKKIYESQTCIWNWQKGVPVLFYLSLSLLSSSVSRLTIVRLLAFGYPLSLFSYSCLLIGQRRMKNQEFHRLFTLHYCLLSRSSRFHPFGSWGTCERRFRSLSYDPHFFLYHPSLPLSLSLSLEAESFDSHSAREKREREREREREKERGESKGRAAPLITISFRPFIILVYDFLHGRESLRGID